MEQDYKESFSSCFMNKLRVGIIGTGYVGLVSGVCFGELGFPITCGDVIEEKVNKINQGIPPIYEKGLETLLNNLLKKNLIKATLVTKEVVENSDIIFICTGTPSDENGTIDLKFVKSASENIGAILRETNEFKTVVVKSTVVPGTTSNIVGPILEKSSGKKIGEGFGLGMNPEFLKEGVAIEDFRKPDRVVIGAEDDRAKEMIAKLYESFDCPKLFTTSSTAEMIKYASNSFLAVKISFINEIANMSEKMGVNIDDVAKGMGMDSRISPKFLRPGLGYGGSCFPKDVKALKSAAETLGVNALMLKASLDVNDAQPLRAVQILEEYMNLNGKQIGFLGMAFKPDTDDMRESRAIPLAASLISKGAVVKGYDPIAKDNAMMTMPQGTIFEENAIDVIKNSDAVILVTEWDEFKGLKAKDFADMKGEIIIDGRRIFKKEDFEASRFKLRILGDPK
jgi:UDPglucose 6-dehydrogenase